MIQVNRRAGAVMWLSRSCNAKKFQPISCHASYLKYHSVCVRAHVRVHVRVHVCVCVCSVEYRLKQFFFAVVRTGT